MGSFKNTMIVFFMLMTCGLGQQIRAITAYQNCDQKWHSEQINGDSQKTICQNGSLVSCISMILQTSGKTINNRAVNPAILNKYLTNNNGYKQGSEINFSVLDKVGLHIVKTVSDLRTAIEYYNNKYYIVLNINYGKNYGVLIGYNEKDAIYLINNPINPSETKVAAKDITVALIFKPL
ncbi:unnamed protein product (macronuclear) [Paramecium tetraurelia]|uniref:Peptidase C39-like domain-containing protein n=1 Tax=Paramecium tetraurelia TaxID=5888 RepID=A0CV27_PARTE|nr:uncharacterized protein GSPATT00010812001 [Paramecium tetraurelia]CAK74644.1 unnamed protein product [Paramecium tetraurelia]|eukprot:XP_001442041.1 hypothetical protein (macronuclear) [Paramecium tetraurelia strain d4-2]